MCECTDGNYRLLNYLELSILVTKLLPVHLAILNLLLFASTAGGLRTCDDAPFASFKKYASHFLNPAFGVTEPKEASYTGTGGNLKVSVC
jgi:hypothetical protein